MLKQWWNDPAPAARTPAAVPGITGGGGLELSDDELESVVGGLERIFVPPAGTAADGAD
jgi:hypothetical protein